MQIHGCRLAYLKQGICLSCFKEWVWYAKNYGAHDGADAFEFISIVNSILNDVEPYVDIHRGLDMTLPGIMSKTSMENNGEWVDVPDSRLWL